MASRQKASDLGWMYHAPKKIEKSAEPVAVPPPSQIPGLGQDGGDYQEDMPKTSWIKDTDSKYIRLAKQGGRQDLLQFREPKPRSEEAVGYPRNEWFYLEDNAIEDETREAKKGDYEFLLPEYMVHKDFKPSVDPAADLKRAPYAFDKTSVFQREGDQASDKRVKVPESKRSGYGVRSEKQQGKPVKYNMPKQERGKPPSENLQQQKPVLEPPKPASDRPAMGKLLAYGYAQDWEKDNLAYHDKLKKMTAKMDQTKVTENSRSEYQEVISKTQKTGQTKTAKQDRPNTQTKSQGKKETETEKEMFKLSKFKNVPAKTETHRTHQSVAVALQ